MKTFFYRIRIPLLEWYLVAATCYFCMLAMDLNLLVVAIVIGFVYTYLYDPIAYALEPDVSTKGVAKVERDISSEKPEVLKQIIQAFVVCSFIYGIYYLVNLHLFPTAVDPYSFGAIYWILNNIFRKLIKIWK